MAPRESDARHCPRCGTRGVLPLDQAHDPSGAIVDPTLLCPDCGNEFLAIGMTWLGAFKPPDEGIDSWATDIATVVTGRVRETSTITGMPFTTGLTTICRKYHRGEIDWAEARAQLLAFPFRQPSDEEYGLDADGRSWLPGTVDEILACNVNGLITEDEYRDFLQGWLDLAEGRRT